jgi:hypothetical protein
MSCFLAVWISNLPLQDVSTPIRGEDCRVWQDAPPYEHPPWPGPIVYDSFRGVTIMVAAGSTWEYDGERWQRYDDAGPSSVSSNTIAFDAARKVTVAFEIYIDNQGQHSRTWEWNGRNWTRHNAASPPLRQSPVLAYNARTSETVLFGGHFVETGTTDLYAWNGFAWSKRAYPRGGPDVVTAMGYDDARRQFLVVGYSWQGGNQMWELSNTWILRGGAPTWDSFVWGRRVMIIRIGAFGPCAIGPGICLEMWEWNGSQWERLPPALRNPTGDWRSFCYDGARDVIVAPGIPADDEYHGYVSADTWEWAEGVWQLTQTSGPAPRRGHAMVYDEARAASMIFGGSQYLWDTWYWDGFDWEFMYVGGPSPREFHAMARDTGRGVTVLFGGIGPYGQVAKQHPLPDTWEWNGIYWSDAEVIGPGARWAHTMAYDKSRAVTVLFGGVGIETDGSRAALGDTWVWDGHTWNQAITIGPSPRSGHAMAYDSAREVIVLFGGHSYDEQGAHQYFGDTWEWSGQWWTLRNSEGPAPRADHAMAYDEGRNAVIVFGGVDAHGRALDDTWEWGPNQWKRRAAMGEPRSSHAMSYDVLRETLVAYGGDWAPNTVSELQPGFSIYDAERDCDVDLFDVAELQTCFGESPLFLDCERFDFDGDGAVDEADFTLQRSELTGPR